MIWSYQATKIHIYALAAATMLGKRRIAAAVLGEPASARACSSSSREALVISIALLVRVSECRSSGTVNKQGACLALTCFTRRLKHDVVVTAD